MAMLFLPTGPKHTNLIEDVEFLASNKVRQIRFSGFREQVKNVSANQRPGGHLRFPISLKITNLVEEVEFLVPVKFRQILFSDFRDEVEKVSTNQRPGGHLGFPISPKDTTLVEDFEFLLPVKFRPNSNKRFQRSQKCSTIYRPNLPREPQSTLGMEML